MCQVKEHKIPDPVITDVVPEGEMNAGSFISKLRVIRLDASSPEVIMTEWGIDCKWRIINCS